MFFNKITKSFKKRWTKDLTACKNKFNVIFTKIYEIETFIENEKKKIKEFNLEKKNNFDRHYSQPTKKKDKRLQNFDLLEKEVVLILHKIKHILLDLFVQLELEEENNIQNNNNISNSLNTSGDMSLKLSLVEYENIEEINQDINSNLIFFLLSFFMIIMFILLFYLRLINKENESDND